MQEIPSDVLLLTIDYLDSPTMINCRQVSKKWLDVVDGNRSLYSFFYLPRDSKPFNQKMIDLFTEKSVSGLRAVSISQKVEHPKRLINLLNSSSHSTLRYFLLENLCTPSGFFPNSLSLMRNLCCFSYYVSSFEHNHPKFTIREDTSSSQDACSLTTFHLLDNRFSNYSSQELGWCSTSIKHLAIMVKGRGPFETLQFPNLQVLELHCSEEPCRFSFESCPILKAVFLDIYCPGSISIKGLPASLEKVWLSWSFASSFPSLESAGLQELDSSFPNLEKLRLEDSFRNDDKIFDVIRARRSAVEQGVEVQGIKMKPIQKLTVRKDRFSNQTWSELEDLVEDLVDLKDAPKVEAISV